MTAPDSTWSTGWSWYSSAVTTPKLPPPPRIAQKRSELDFGLASTCLLSTVTTCADSRLSHAAPYFSIKRPSPPPSVKPAIPTVGQPPEVVASLKCWVGTSRIVRQWVSIQYRFDCRIHRNDERVARETGDVDPLAFRQGGHRQHLRGSKNLPESLVLAEEICAIASVVARKHDWTTDRPAELIAIERGYAATV